MLLWLAALFVELAFLAVFVCVECGRRRVFTVALFFLLLCVRQLQVEGLFVWKDRLCFEACRVWLGLLFFFFFIVLSSCGQLRLLLAEAPRWFNSDRLRLLVPGCDEMSDCFVELPLDLLFDASWSLSLSQPLSSRGFLMLEAERLGGWLSSKSECWYLLRAAIIDRGLVEYGAPLSALLRLCW